MLRFIFIRTAVVFFLSCAYVSAADLSISDRRGGIDDLITVTVSANNAPTPVKAFAFSLAYNPYVLNYHSYQQTGLADNCDVFYANNNAIGEIKVLGVDLAGMIKEGDSGEILRLVFQVVGIGDCEIKFTEVKDDMKTWHTQSGKFTGETEPGQDEANNGEDNQDQELNENINPEEVTGVPDKPEEGLQQDIMEDPASFEKLPDSLTTSVETLPENGKQSGSNDKSSMSGNKAKKGSFDFTPKKKKLTITDKSITANQTHNTIKKKYSNSLGTEKEKGGKN